MDIGAGQATVQGITKESDIIKATQQQLVRCVPSHAGTLEVRAGRWAAQKEGLGDKGDPRLCFCLLPSAPRCKDTTFSSTR